MRHEHHIENVELRGKMERIQELSAMGFNVPDYYLIGDKETLGYFKREIMPKYERMSVRTYSKTNEITEFKCPHFPNWLVKTPEGDGDVQAGIADMVDNLQEKYAVLVAPPINPQECLFAGNVVVPEMWNNDIIWEYIIGPGTVRDVEKRGITITTNRQEKIDIHPDFEVIRKKILSFPKEEVIIEWSIYQNPVGKDKSNIVFWEYRPYNG